VCVCMYACVRARACVCDIYNYFVMVIMHVTLGCTNDNGENRESVLSDESQSC